MAERVVDVKGGIKPEMTCLPPKQSYFTGCPLNTERATVEFPIVVVGTHSPYVCPISSQEMKNRSGVQVPEKDILVSALPQSAHGRAHVDDVHVEDRIPVAEAI